MRDGWWHHGLDYLSVQKSKDGKLFIEHGLYGQIPLRPLGRGYVCSLDYKPTLPKGAVRADVKNQRTATLHSGDGNGPFIAIPRYFYFDQSIKCLTCRKQERFTMREQKRWYEDFKIPVYIEVNHCARCRMIQRTQVDLAATVRCAQASPHDPAALLNEAKNRIALFQLIGKGNLERAMACVRQARRLKPTLYDTWFWEAVVYQIRKNWTKAIVAYDTFLKSKPAPPLELRREAESRLADFQKEIQRKTTPS